MELVGASNFRDVGGVRGANSARGRPTAVRRGRLFRSDELSRVDSDGWATLAGARGVRLVCDLRRAEEALGYEARGVPAEVRVLRWEYDAPAAAAMDARAAAIRAHLAPLAAMDAPQLDAWAAEQHAGYARLPFAMLDPLRGVVEELARPDAAPTVVHCAAGKDRTGVAVALVLALLGVAREDILADYMVTSENYLRNPPTRDHLLPLLRRAGLDELPESVLLALSIARRPALEAVLDAWENSYEGARGFAENVLGISQDTLDRLRENLLEEVDDGAL